MEISYTLPRICAETIDSYAFTNRELIEGTPKGIILCFHGLGHTALRNEYTAFEERCAREGVLTVFPYYGPWSWMNMTAVRYVDEIVAVLRGMYGLGADVPVVSSGGSMGGLSALIYMRYAAVTPAACFANCPVCDLPFHATERPDLPRTVYLAFCGYECGLEAALKMHSPLHQAAEMPKVPYYVVHGCADAAVNKAMHSDRFVAAMRAAGHRIVYREVPGMTHCNFETCPDERAAYEDAMLSFCR